MHFVDGVGFEEDGSEYKKSISTRQEKGMTAWLVRRGWAKSPEQAEKILLGVIIINILIIVFAFIYGSQIKK